MGNKLGFLFNQAGNAWVPNWFQLFSDNKNGGFHERLDFNGNPLDMPRRLLTQCRQIMVYSLAQKQNPEDPKYLAKLEEGFQYIKDHYFNKITRGSIFSIDAQSGEAIDKKYDLYGHAFVMLACASYLNVKDSEEVKTFAKTTLNFIKENFRAKNGIGLEEALDEELKPIPSIRRQNPHMHLMEASIYMYEATGDKDYLDMADEMLELFFDKLLDPQTKTLGEFFEDDLSPHKSDGNLVEAGHHAEWVWLLKRYQEVSNSDDPRIQEMMNTLFDWVVKNGVDKQHGGVVNGQQRDGTIVDANKRIWPTLETIRAASIMANDSAYADVARQLVDDLTDILERNYIDVETGLWNEFLNPDMSVKTDYRPGTTPYHIYPVIAEASEFMPKVLN